MLAFTIGGQAGAGAPEIGRKVARELGGRYVEHMALRRLARELGASAEAVTRKELGFCSRRDRFLASLELLFSRIGWYGADFAADGYPAVPYMLDRPDVKTLPAEISDKEYVAGVYRTAHSFIDEGNDVILVKRAGCITLKDQPGVVHLGLFSPWASRVNRMANRLGVGISDAEDIVLGLEKARAGWFTKISGADPSDPDLYTLKFETGETMSDEQVAQRAVSNALEMRFGSAALAS